MKKIVFGLAVFVIATIVAFNVNLGTKKTDKVSLLALTNVEAQADEENNPTEKYAAIMISDQGWHRTDCVENIQYYYHLVYVDCLGTGSLNCISGFDVIEIIEENCYLA